MRTAMSWCEVVHTAAHLGGEGELERQIKRIQDDAIDSLKEALRDAILSNKRVYHKCIDHDPAGSTYEVDWLPEVKELAKLADLDLDKHSPENWSK